MPLGRARRACRALRRLRPQPHRLQFVPQPPPAFARAGYCPKCQGAAATDWLAAREANLLPVGYFHVVFTLPAEIAPIANLNAQGFGIPSNSRTESTSNILYIYGPLLPATHVDCRDREFESPLH